MEAVALIYIVVAAQCNGWHYLLFPGLAALSHDVLTRPWGRWASQPGRLIATPVLAAAVGRPDHPVAAVRCASHPGDG